MRDVIFTVSNRNIQNNNDNNINNDDNNNIMNGALHPRADVDRLYVTRGEGGSGCRSVEDVVIVEIHSLSDYLKRAEVNLNRIYYKRKRETGTDK